jgi:hypothetical protein
MIAWMRNTMRVALVGAVLTATGCSLGSLAYFLTPEQKNPPEICSLASPDSKQEVRVVILPALVHTLAVPEAIGVERDLAETVARRLHELLTAGDNIRIIAPRKIEDYKNKHSDWKENPRAVGEYFKADYVVYLEIYSLSLFEHGSQGELFRGRMEMAVNLLSIAHPDYTPQRKVMSFVFPDQPRAAELGTSQLEFRNGFLDHVARRVSYCFAAHPRMEAHQRARQPFGLN